MGSAHSDPICWFVPFAPGGNTDIIARAISQKMTEDLGQQIVIDNRGGAASTLGNSPDEYDRYNRAEIARRIDVARKAGVPQE